MDTENKEIIDGICSYAEQARIKEILAEYLRRLVVEKPADPLNFLLRSVREHPYDPTGVEEED